MGAQSPLDELIACVHYRVLLCMDEGCLCNMASSCRSLASVAAEQALWRRLAMCRDALAAERFLGSCSPEAAFPVSLDDAWRPYAPQTGTVDWRDVCRQLNKSMAERPWDQDGAALWTELSDEEATILASQSPHLFWIAGDQLLGIAGR